MNSKKYVAEAIGTFWLVLGGCGSAVLAAAFPEVGIGLVGVSLAFGLTVLTMAYAIGHISGCHLNPAVTVGLTAGGRFPASDVVPYIIAQVIGGLIGAAVLYIIASGAPGFDLAKGFASNGYGELSPGKYGLLRRAVVTEVVMTAMFLFIILGSTHGRAPGRLRPDRDRPRPDPDPSDLDPGHQHLGQPGPQHRGRGVRRRRLSGPALAVLGGADHRRRHRRCALRLAVAERGAAGHRQQPPPLSLLHTHRLLPRGLSGRGVIFCPCARTKQEHTFAAYRRGDGHAAQSQLFTERCRWRQGRARAWTGTAPK